MQKKPNIDFINFFLVQFKSKKNVYNTLAGIAGRNGLILVDELQQAPFSALNISRTASRKYAVLRGTIYEKTSVSLLTLEKTFFLLVSIMKTRDVFTEKQVIFGI